jgi:S-(hydroxymethyl)glutathione dehydrogenase/alcohol dehydrogenase
VTGRVWRGTAFGGARGRSDRRLVHAGKDSDRPDDTHTLPLTEINKAFDLMRNGESIRSVVVY